MQRIEKSERVRGTGPQVKELVWLPATGGDVDADLAVNSYGRPHFARDTTRVYIYERGGWRSSRCDGTAPTAARTSR